MDILIAQIIGVLAFLIFIFSVQTKNKKQLLVLQLLANFLYGIQYLLLIAVTACFMNLISVVRCYIFYLYEEKKKKPSILVLVILLLLIIVVSIFTINNYLGIIPVLITIIYTISTWQNNIKLTRYAFTIAAIFWIIYNISIGAWAALIGNTFELISGTIAIIRFKKKN